MQSPAASRTGRLALLGRQVVQHAMQRAIPASAVATAGAHIPPGGGPYYTAEEEEALKGQIMQCEGKCTVTRGNCYQGCR